LPGSVQFLTESTGKHSVFDEKKKTDLVSLSSMIRNRSINELVVDSGIFLTGVGRLRNNMYSSPPAGH
jgi:hypothetical protein